MGLYNPEELNQESQISSLTRGVPESFQAPEEPEPLSFQEHMGLQAKSAEQHNWLVSVAHNGFGDYTKSDPDFNAYEKVLGTKYETKPEYFINADNDEEIENAKRLFDEQEEYSALASRAPSTAFWSGMTWAMVDPMLAVPGFGSIKLAKIGKTISTAKTAAYTGGITAGVLGAEEAILHGNQPERTINESIFNMAAGGVVGAALGGLVAKTFKPRDLSINNFAESIDPALAQTATKEAEAEHIMQYNAQQDSQFAIKKVLEADDDTIPVNYEEVYKNIPVDHHKSIEEILDEHNMAGHTSPITRYWDEQVRANQDPKIVAEEKIKFEAQMADEEELAELLKPKNTEEITNLEDLQKQSTQSMGADYISYDVRVKGIHPRLLKMMAIPYTVNPKIEGMASPSAIVRDFTTISDYVHYPLERVTKKQIPDESSPGKYKEVEERSQVTAPLSFASALEEDWKIGIQFNEAMDRSYIKYLQINSGDTTKWGSVIKSKFNKNIASSKNFDELTMDGLNANDYHAIPEVQERVLYSRNILNNAWKRMQDVGLVDKNQKPFPSYFKVIWDIPYIIKHRTNLLHALSKRYLNKQKVKIQYIKDNGKEASMNGIYDAATSQLNWQPRNGEVLKSITQLGVTTPDDALEAANDSIDNILQMGDSSLQLGDIDRLSFTRNTDSMQPRKVVMGEDDYVALKEFMVKDFRSVMHNYLSSVSRAVNFKKVLDKYGWNSIQDGRKAIRDEFKDYIFRIQNNKTLSLEKRDKLISKLETQRESSIKLFNDLVAIDLGQFQKRSKGDALWRVTNQYNINRLYGGILLSSLGDPIAMTVKNSLPHAVWNGWLSVLKQWATGTHGLKKQDYLNAMTAQQNALNDLTKILIDPSDQGSYGTGIVERGFRKANQLQFKVSITTAWNDYWQKASHNLAEYNITSYLRNPSKKGEAYLKEIGIGSENNMTARIKKMVDKYHEDVRGTFIANTHQWSDQEAAAYFNNAIRTEVHKSPIITEKLDLPRWVQRSEFRKQLLLGKGYMFAANTKLVMSMAARHDAKTLQALILLPLAGMGIQMMYDKIAGRDSDYSLMGWIGRGVDKSGFLSIWSEPFLQIMRSWNGVENFGGRAWIQSPIDYMLGPSGSAANAIFKWVRLGIQGESPDIMTQYQLKSLIPYGNLWYYKLLKAYNRDN